MDAIYSHQRHIYDATRKYFLFGRDRLIEELQPGPGDHVLEIGCGTGRNLILAAKRYTGASFFGIDISEAMLRTARANVARAGLSDRIVLAHGDATAFSPKEIFGETHFERVFVSYALSMITDWRGALAQAFRVTAPRGRLHVVDFGQQERLPTAIRSLLRAWLKRFHVEPRAELVSALSSIDSEICNGVAFTALYGGYAWLIMAQR